MPASSPWTGRLFACGLSLCAVSAEAQIRRVAVLGVAVEGADEADAAHAARAIWTFVGSDPRFESVSPAIQARDDGPVREAKGIEARRLFNEGRDQLDNLATAKAIATLEKSIKFYEASDLSQGVQGLQDALALRAIASLSKGDKSGFNNDAQRALAINPGYEFDPSRLTPAAQAALEPLRKKFKTAPPVALELASTPPNAWAFVDGVFRGVTPLSVPGLAPGSHLVTLVATGFELVQEKVFAGSGAGPSFTLKSSSRGKEVLARIGELRAAIERGEPGAAAGTLAGFIQAEELLVAVVSKQKGALGAAVHRVLADGTVVGDVRRPLSDKSAGADWQAMAKELLALSAPAPKKKTPAFVLEELPAGSSRAGRRPFGWVGLALTAGAAGAGVGLGLVSKGTAQSANRTPQVDTAAYDRLASSAKTQAAVADGMFIGTAVLGGLSIFLLATGYSDDGESTEEDAGLLFAPTLDGALVGLRGSF